MKRKSLFSTVDGRKAFDLREISEESGIPISTLYDWARRGLIPGAIRRGKGAKWRFQRAELERWWQELQGSEVLSR